MKLVDQWHLVESTLPADWEEVRLTVTTEQPSDLQRAAQVLGAMNAGRSGESLALHVQRAGGAQGAGTAERLFGRLDDARVWCLLRHETVERTAVAAAVPGREGTTVPVATSWDSALAPLPPDWSDLLCELDVTSSDYLDRAALLCAPLNPARVAARLAFTFRCARRTGYGVSPTMARRCFERLDDEGLTGAVRVVRVLSDTDNVSTQGPVWLVGGKVL